MFRNCTQDDITADNIYCVKLSQLSNSFDMIELLRTQSGFENCDIQTEIATTNKIWYRNYQYKLNFVVCVAMGNIYPEFGLISDILVTQDNNCFFIVKKLCVDYFDRDYFWFRVTFSDAVFSIVNVKDLYIHDCLEIMKNCKTVGNFISVLQKL